MNKEYSEQVGGSRAKFPMSSIWGCVWRGAVGGMIGPLAFILFMAARRPNDALAIAYLPIILPITAVVGAIIGMIVAFLHVVAGLRMRRLVGLGIGTAFSICIYIVYVYLTDNDLRAIGWLPELEC